MATYLGVPGGEDRLDDLSPAGLAEGNELVLRTLQRTCGAADVDRHRRRHRP